MRKIFLGMAGVGSSFSSIPPKKNQGTGPGSGIKKKYTELFDDGSG
jgi:hypothetical protein